MRPSSTPHTPREAGVAVPVTIPCPRADPGARRLTGPIPLDPPAWAAAVAGPGGPRPPAPPRLKIFQAADNRLTGPVPEELMEYPSLLRLHLGGNNCAPKPKPYALYPI